MDNSVEGIVRDAKLIALLVVAVVGGGALAMLVVAEYTRLAFYGTILFGVLASLLLVLSR